MLPASDFDGPWKEALDVYFPDILAFFFPQAFAGIDWSHQYEPLDKELQQVAPTDSADQMVDELVQVRRLDGADAWVLIHIEVQSQSDPDFAERMSRYHARLCDRFRRQIISLAILGDERQHWRPSSFGYELWGCTLARTFPTVKLLDFDLAILERDNNPCATVVLAHRIAQMTRRDPDRRMTAKLALTRRLYERGYNREGVVQLYRFIDWLLRLPPELDDEAWQQLRNFEEERRMPYITYAERVGRASGVVEGLQTALTTILQTRFSDRSEDLQRAVRRIDDPERLQALLTSLLTAENITDAREAIAKQQQNG